MVSFEDLRVGRGIWDCKESSNILICMFAPVIKKNREGKSFKMKTVTKLHPKKPLNRRFTHGQE
jgi:hypothetical protein